MTDDSTKITNILKDPRDNFNYQAPFQQPNSPEDGIFINDLFAKLESIRPAFKLAWPGDEGYENAKISWLRALKLAKLRDGVMIQEGLDRLSMMDSSFIPSPGQFIALCHKESKPQSDTRNQRHFLEHKENHIMSDNDPKKWKPGYVFAKHAHLNSRDKAMPVIEKLLEKMANRKVNK